MLSETERTVVGKKTYKTDDNNDCPVPFLLESNRDNDVAKVHDDNVRDHGQQSHLWLTDTSVLECRALADPIRQLARGEKTNEGADENGKVHESNVGGGEIVWWVGKVQTLGQVEGQERTAGPRDNKCGKLDNGESEELPWKPEVERHRLERGWVRLEEHPLLLGRVALSEMRVTRCGGGVAEFGHGSVGVCGGELLLDRRDFLLRHGWG